MSDDRTFCSNKECNHFECEVHQKNIRDIWRDRSVADYEGSLYCKKTEQNSQQADKRLAALVTE